MTTSPASSYFRRISGARFQPTEHTGGAWVADEQHIAPMFGLVVHELERFVAERGAGGELVTSRLSFDILGVIRLEAFDIVVEVVRPGRTIELLEACVIADGRAVVRARAWRTATYDTAHIAGGAAPPLPAPDSLEPWPMSTHWSGGYIDSIDVRVVGSPQPGRTTAWISTPVALVEGEASSELARFVGLVDTANGIAPRSAPERVLFPNLDLTIHLHRQPAGRWVGLDTSVTFGPSGQGTTATVLHDERGAVGSAAQLLTVRPLD